MPEAFSSTSPLWRSSTRSSAGCSPTSRPCPRCSTPTRSSLECDRRSRSRWSSSVSHFQTSGPHSTSSRACSCSRRAERPTVGRTMADVRAEELDIGESDDVVRVRQAVRDAAVELGFSIVDQTKVVTAASELARNTYIYGGGGHFRLGLLNNGRRPAL